MLVLWLIEVEFSSPLDKETPMFDVFDDGVVKMDLLLHVKEVDVLSPFQCIEWQLWRPARTVVFYVGKLHP